jgi:hypothetical protein
VDYNPVDRFLADAEAMARRGEVARTFEFLLLALDTEPGDLSVLSRAQAVRKLLPAEVGSPSLDLKGDPTDVPLLPTDLPKIGAIQLVEDVYEPMDPRELKKAMESARAASSRKPSPKINNGRQRKLSSLLWKMTIAAFVAAALVIAKPGMITKGVELLQASRDPLVKAERLYSAGNALSAVELAKAALESGNTGTTVRANLLLGRIAIEGGDISSATRHLIRASSDDSGWEIPMEAGRLLLVAGDTSAAADAYRRAFHNLAPMSEWPAIISVLRAAGDMVGASSIESSLSGGAR